MDQWRRISQGLTKDISTKTKKRIRKSLWSETVDLRDKQAFWNFSEEAKVCGLSLEKIFETTVTHHHKKRWRDFLPHHKKNHKPTGEKSRFFSFHAHNDQQLNISTKHSASMKLAIVFNNEQGIIEFNTGLSQLKLERFKVNVDEQYNKEKIITCGEENAQRIVTLINGISPFDKEMRDSVLVYFYPKTLHIPNAKALMEALKETKIYTPDNIDIRESIGNFYQNYPG